MKVVVFTLGCKVNEVESAQIMAKIEEFGWQADNKLSYADAYVLNTCAVTAEAEKKSRQLIARVKKFNPQAKIFVCGCASEKDKGAFEDKGVYFVTGANSKEQVIESFCRAYGYKWGVMPYPKQTRTRGFIKIQDGCNNFCSYCIIPYLRGRERSRSIEDIVREANLTSSYEIVLNGINISSYSYGLDNLISALKNTNKRIRLGSLECNVITDKLLVALKNLQDFAPQFHLSLQSGSTKVLKSMNRHYTREEYIEKCKLIYSYFPSCAITTDIIAGFPTETKEDFFESLSIIDEVQFARVHAFTYSKREGTAAFKLQDLSHGEKFERMRMLIEKAKIAQEKYIEKFIGTKTDFIAEEFDGEYTCGYTGNYIRIYIKEELPNGKKYDIILKEPFYDGLLAIRNA